MRPCIHRRPSPTPLVLTLLLTGLLPPASVAGQLATPNITGVSFGHLHLNVADLNVHRRIWVDHFGGTWVDRDPVRAAWLPGTLIMFNERVPTGGTIGSVLDHVGFTVPDRDAFVDRWRADGFEVAQLFESEEGVRQAYLLTPDGLRIELFEDLGAMEATATHHVHVLAEDPEETLAQYAQRFGLEPRARGSIANTADVPGMNLSFSQAEEHLVSTRNRVVDHIGFEVVNLETFVARLEEQGMVFDVPYQELDGIGIAIAFYTDPAGVFVELTEGLPQYR